MVRLFLIAFIFISLSIVSASPQTAERQMEGDGVWRAGAAEADGAQCKRIWHCVSDTNIPLYADEELSYSPIARTSGHCADNACLKCAAPQPTEICSWRIVERK